MIFDEAGSEGDGDETGFGVVGEFGAKSAVVRESGGAIKFAA